MKTEQIYLSRYGIGKKIFVEHGGCTIKDPAHINDCYMAAYIAHGSGVLEITDETVSVNEGDVFFINPDVLYRFVPEKGLRRIDIYFCLFSYDALKAIPDRLDEQFPVFADLVIKNTSFIHAVDTDNKEIRNLYIRMIDESLSNMPGGYDAITGYLIVLLTKIFRNTKTRDFRRVYNQNRTVDQAMRYINKHMYSKVSLNDLASHLKLSPSFICHLFKEHVGMTTSQFINLLRVDKIKDVLKNTDKPIQAIPEMFNCNIDYLKRVFKRETGMTMQEYKDKYHYKIAPEDEE